MWWKRVGRSGSPIVNLLRRGGEAIELLPALVGYSTQNDRKNSVRLAIDLHKIKL